MPTIEFSSVAMSKQMEIMYSVPNLSTTSMPGTTAFRTPLCWESLVQTRIFALRGTRPTTRPTDLSTISPDILVIWSGTTHWNGDTGPVTMSMVGTTHTIQITSTLTTAQLSGTATWFALVNHNTSAPNLVYGWVTGSVGLPGSGADLIIANTNIVSGQSYKIANLTLTQTSVFTY